MLGAFVDNCVFTKDNTSLIREIIPFILGLDPLEHEVIWQRLYHNGYWCYAGGSVAFAAISALDMAMWDIKGKAAGLPLYKLLGGKLNEKIRAYASQIQLGWGDFKGSCVTPEDYVQCARNAVAQVYRRSPARPGCGRRYHRDEKDH